MVPALMTRKREKYLALREGCFLVRGPRRSAVYDLRAAAIFSLDPLPSTLLEKYGAGRQPVSPHPDDETPEQAAARQARERSPFTRVTESPVPSPKIETALAPRDEQPRGGVWLEPTNRCNLRCIHCYAASGPPLPEELSTQQWRDVIHQLLKSGFRHFTVCGGEPFVFADLATILRDLTEGGAESVTVLTNATLLKGDIVAYCCAHGISFGVTFYSHLREHHEKITAVAGSWQSSLDGIRMLLNRGASFTVNIPLGAVNQDDLPGTFALLQELGIPPDRMGGNIVYPLGRGCDPHVLPSQETIFSVRREIYEIPVTADGRLLYQTCWRGKLLITADGLVTPCPSAREERFVVGDLKRQPLAQVLENKRLHDLWNITLDQVPVCRSCEFRYACHDCRANAWVYSHDLTSRNPYCSYDPQKGTWRPPPNDAPSRLLNAVISRTDGFEVIDTQGEPFLIVHRRSGAAHMLNPTAAFIYRMLDRPRPGTEILRALVEHFDADEATLRRDLEKLLIDACRSGIVNCS